MGSHVISELDKHSFKEVKSWVQTMDKDIRMVLLAIIVGLVGGLSAILFRILIEGVFTLLYELPDGNLPRWFLVLLAPTLGGLIVGYIINTYSAESKGHGIPQVIQAVNHEKGKIRFRVPIIKMIASAITIGSGGSAGREGPIAQIGGGMGSALGQIFDLRENEVKDLVIGGVAAGIAASFNAPLGGILFGLELIRRDNRTPSIIPLVTSTVVGTAIGQFFLGDYPSYKFPSELNIDTIANLPFLLIMGLLIGVISVVWIFGLFYMEIGFAKIKLHPVAVAGLGGFMIGLIELFYPEVAGFDSGSRATMNIALAGEISLGLAMILLTMKFLATGITMGSGGSGGIFAPTLFMGAMLGFIFGHIFSYLGFFKFNLALYGVFGMAALFGGAMRAPLTSVIITAEMVKDFRLLFPLLVVVLSSWLVSKAITKYDSYDIKLIKLKGLRFETEYDILDQTFVRDIMVPAEQIISLEPKDRLERFLLMMKETGHTGFPVMKNDQLLGIITEHDVSHAMENHDMREWAISDICTSHIVSCRPDTPISMLMKKMEDKGINRFPVIQSHEERKLLGWITRSDIIKIYLKEKRLKIQEKVEQELFEELHQTN